MATSFPECAYTVSAGVSTVKVGEKVFSCMAWACKGATLKWAGLCFCTSELPPLYGPPILHLFLVRGVKKKKLQMCFVRGHGFPGDPLLREWHRSSVWATGTKPLTAFFAICRRSRVRLKNIYSTCHVVSKNRDIPFHWGLYPYELHVSGIWPIRNNHISCSKFWLDIF